MSVPRIDVSPCWKNSDFTPISMKSNGIESTTDYSSHIFWSFRWPSEANRTLYRATSDKYAGEIFGSPEWISFSGFWNEPSIWWYLKRMAYCREKWIFTNTTCLSQYATLRESYPRNMWQYKANSLLPNNPHLSHTVFIYSWRYHTSFICTCTKRNFVFGFWNRYVSA